MRLQLSAERTLGLQAKEPLRPQGATKGSSLGGNECQTCVSESSLPDTGEQSSEGMRPTAERLHMESFPMVWRMCKRLWQGGEGKRCLVNLHRVFAVHCTAMRGREMSCSEGRTHKTRRHVSEGEDREDLFPTVPLLPPWL